MRKRINACSIARIVMAFACVGLLVSAPSVRATESGNGISHFSGYVWIDTNGNGSKDADEPFSAGVTVTPQLETSSGGFTNYSTTSTNSEGYYSITLPQNGRWRLHFSNPDGSKYIPTKVNSSTDATKNSCITPLSDNDKSGVTTVYVFDNISASTGTTYANINAGFTTGTSVTGTATIAGIAFLEMEDVNHYYEENRDTLLRGVTVTLFDENRNQIASMVTDDNGKFEFKDQPRNKKYRLRYNLPSNMALTFVNPNTGSFSNMNSLNISKAVADVTMSGQAYADVTLSEGDTTFQSVGCYANNYITGYVWEDQNQDGRRDNNEPAIQNLEVVVMTADGQPYTGTGGGIGIVARTNTSGKYTVAGLQPGMYRLLVRKRASADVFTAKQKQGVEDALSSKVDANGFTDVITISTTTGMGPQRFENVNAGLYSPYYTTPTPTPTPWYYSTPTPTPQYYTTPTPTPQYYYTPTPSPIGNGMTPTPDYTDGNFENMSKTGESIVPLILSLSGGLAVVYAAFLILHRRKRPKA